MMHCFLSIGKVTEKAKLNYLDQISAIIAGACHDFEHDGYNNSYHVNFMTHRAVRYHDKAVQENWHASKSIEILLDPQNNFIESFSEDEKKVFRKRMVGMILATDMADHMSHMNVLENKINHKHISKERNNGHLLIDTSNEVEKFESQQMCLD